MCRLLKVKGQSLEPIFRDGDFVLISKIPILSGNIQLGDQIVFRHAIYGTLIKLIEEISPDGDNFFVRGTNINSVDSRRFGSIQKRDIIGKVIWHFKKS
jgi:signal peptidase I